MSDQELTIQYLLKRTEYLEELHTTLQTRNDSLKNEVFNLSQRKIKIELSQEYYRKVIDLIYTTSIETLKNSIDFALGYVFHDKDYSIRIELDSKRATKEVNFYLIDSSEDGEEPLELGLKDGIGTGGRIVISFVVHIYYILTKNTLPILFLDEAYTGVSTEYIDRFFSFVKIRIIK